MKHFKLPLIATAIAFALGLILTIAAVTWIYNADLSNRQKTLRAQKLGSGLGVATCLVVTPFWLFAAAKVGKERRKAREAAGR